MIIANYMVEHTDLDQVWMIVSPQNPLKKKSSLANDRERLHMVRLAIGDNPNLKGSDIEFDMPIPSYTIDTLAHLKEQYSYHTFVLLMGGDNLPTLPKWKNYEKLIAENEIYVFNRPGYDLGPLANHDHVSILEDSPVLDISASFIRKCRKEKKSIRYLVPEPIFHYIDGSSLYQK
jgi:nicotinate-nucleotide adenylyltransferase